MEVIPTSEFDLYSEELRKPVGKTPISVAVVYADIVGARASWDVIGREDPHW